MRKIYIYTTTFNDVLPYQLMNLTSHIIVNMVKLIKWCVNTWLNDSVR